MGLDDITNPDKSNNSGSGKRRYVRIEKEEFEDFLHERPERWGLVNWSKAKELVYRTAQFAPEDEDLSLYCYSTIDERTNRSRDKGSDAIRLVAVYKEQVHLRFGEKKTLRIQTWRKNLSKKIDSMIERGAAGIRFCDECGNVMVKREGKYGDFFGCNSYPSCDYTEQMEE